MGRLLAVFGGIVWLGAIAFFAFAVQWSEQPRKVAPLTPVPTLLRQLNAARTPQMKEGESWVVTKVTSAHHVLVVNVDADRVGDARAIASEIVAPVRDRGFEEVLVYVWKMRGHKTYADRRVQWTPRGGYSELVIGDE
jgi:hypothetical protein